MNAKTISTEELTGAIQRLPQTQRKFVFLFIEFLEHLTEKEQAVDTAEDDALWEAVLAHLAYRQAHPDEEPEVFDTPEAFLQATAAL